MTEIEYVEGLLFQTNENGVAIITFNRPEKLNALTVDMRNGFADLVLKIRNDDSLKVLIVTGAGRGFCSGADVNIQAARAAGNKPKKTRHELLDPLGLFVLPLVRLEKPTIAAVNGAAAGIGLSMALACDVRIASQQAKFGAVWVSRGLVPDGAASLLMPELIGLARTAELMYSGNIIDAQEADRIGLVNKVVPPEQLMSTAVDMATKWAKGPSVAIELIKKVLYRNIRHQFETQLDYETYTQNICYGTDDHKEAVDSFVEKRPPKFKGS